MRATFVPGQELVVRAADGGPPSDPLTFTNFEEDAQVITIYSRPPDTEIVPGTFVGVHVSCEQQDSYLSIRDPDGAGRRLICSCGEIIVSVPDDINTFKLLLEHLKLVLN